MIFNKLALILILASLINAIQANQEEETGADVDFIPEQESGLEEEQVDPIRYAVDADFDGVRVKMPYLFPEQPDLDEEHRKLLASQMSEYFDFFQKLLNERIGSKRNAIVSAWSWVPTSNAALSMVRRHKKDQAPYKKIPYHKMFQVKSSSMFDRLMKDSARVAKQSKEPKDPARLKQDCASALNLISASFQVSPVVHYLDLENAMIGDQRLYDIAVDLMARLHKNGLGGALGVIEAAMKLVRVLSKN